MQKLSEHQINKQCHAKGCQKHPLFVTAFQPVHKAGDQQQGRRVKAGEMYQPAKRGDQSITTYTCRLAAVPNAIRSSASSCRWKSV